MVMKTNNRRCLFLFSLILLFILEGCSVKKKIISDAPEKNIEVSEIIKNVRNSELKYKNLRNRIKVEFNNGRSVQTVNLNLRALEKEVLWLSASMIVPIAKVLMSNEKFVFYEKFQKTYINQDISQITAIAGFNRPVDVLQRILYGQSIMNLNKSDWKRIENPNHYVLQSTKGLQTTLFFNPKTFNLDQQRIFIPFLSSLITLEYNNYKVVEERVVPNNLLISYIRGNQIIKINLEYSQFDFPENLTFPMEIPANYKIKTLDEILK